LFSFGIKVFLEGGPDMAAWILWSLGAGLVIAGMIRSILRPETSLQDLVSRTHLVPR